MSQPVGTKLDGWKAIANHLEKHVRTVQRWEERHGLPVYRIDGSDDPNGSSVFAYTTELDAWLSQRKLRHLTADAHRRFIPLSLRVAATIVAVVVLSILGLSSLRSPTSPVPITAGRIGEHRLVVYGPDGQELWAKSFATGFSDVMGGPGVPWIVHDLDHDGTSEVLFAHASIGPQPGPDDGVYLFDEDGALLWRYNVGRRITIDGFPYEDAFKVRAMGVGTRVDGSPFIVVAATHRPYAPTQVSILEADGSQIAEYWHFGYVLDLLMSDFDDDGTDEILLGGVNNALETGFIALIEHDIEPAIGPGPTSFPPELQSGYERAYIAFPRAAVSEALGVRSIVKELRPYDGGVLVDLYFDDGSGVHERVYLFDRELAVVRLDFEAPFEALHQRLLADGRVQVDLTEEHRRLLTVERILR